MAGTTEAASDATVSRNKIEPGPVDETSVDNAEDTASETFTRTLETLTAQTLFNNIAGDLTDGLPKLASTAQMQSELHRLNFPRLTLISNLTTDRPPAAGGPVVDSSRSAPDRVESPAETRALDWRGRQLSLTTRDGVAVSYTDENGKVWESRDGRTWIRSDSRGNDIWHGNIRIDASGNLVREDASYGLATTMGADGRITRAFRTRAGQAVSHTQFADGRQRVVDRGATWESADGRSWSSGDQTWQGTARIDQYGRLFWKDAGTGRIERAAESAQTVEINQRIRDMERRYNIRIGRPGYDIPWRDERGDLSVQQRMPTLAELQVVEDSLKKYQHLAGNQRNGQPDFGGLKFVFLSGANQGDRVDVHGWYGRNTITFAPRDFISTEWPSLRQTALHEIAHHLQTLRWTGRDGVQNPPREISDFFGYVQYGRDPKGEPLYRVRDRDGTLWQESEIEVNGKKQEGWRAVRPDGTLDPTRVRTDEEMRAAMPPERRPATHYFITPQEAHAEAMAMFLHDSRMLWNTNPELYHATRRWDQNDLNARYGTDRGPNGERIPRMIRSADGHIVPNTEDNRRRVRDMEESWGPASAAPRTAPRRNLDRVQNCAHCQQQKEQRQGQH